MNAPLLRPFGQLLARSFDFHGLKLDLYGGMVEEGYEVRQVCAAGTLIVMAASPDALEYMNTNLDETLPTSEQLRKESREEARLEHAVWHHDMEIFRLARDGMTYGVRRAL